MNIRSKLNPKVEVSVIAGHFATRHSHNSHYIDITRMKHEHTMAREAAMTLAQRYAYDKGVDTIVCLDGSEVLGAFLARHLSKNDRFAVNSDKNINVITPEYDSNGQHRQSQQQGGVGPPGPRQIQAQQSQTHPGHSAAGT